MWLSLGGFHELSETEGKVHNTHIILDNQGDIKAIYRKVHMFRVAIEGGPNLDETKTTLPGDVRNSERALIFAGVSSCRQPSRKVGPFNLL